MFDGTDSLQVGMRTEMSHQLRQAVLAERNIVVEEKDDFCRVGKALKSDISLPSCGGGTIVHMVVYVEKALVNCVLIFLAGGSVARVDDNHIGARREVLF